MEECVNSGVAEEHDKKYLGMPQVTDAEKEDRANFIERDASAIERKHNGVRLNELVGAFLGGRRRDWRRGRRRHRGKSASAGGRCFTLTGAKPKGKGHNEQKGDN